VTLGGAEKMLRDLYNAEPQMSHDIGVFTQGDVEGCTWW
jgi:hypothetical protein